MERLLVCVDHSAATGAVVGRAERLARSCTGSMILLHVLPEDPVWVGYGMGPPTVRSDVARDLREMRARTQRLASGLRERGLDVISRIVRGPGPETILREGRDLEATIIVMGAHAGGRVHELLLGSVTRKVLRKSDRAVLVVPVPRT